MQMRLAIAAVLFLVWSAAMLCSGLYVGALAGRLGKANAVQKMLAEQQQTLLKEQQADREARKKLQDTLDRLPKAERKHANAVAQNPSDCVRPAAVADSLQRAVDEANAARALPGSP